MKARVRPKLRPKNFTNDKMRRSNADSYMLLWISLKDNVGETVEVTTFRRRARALERMQSSEGCSFIVERYL